MVCSGTTDKPLLELVKEQATISKIATHAFTFLVIPLTKKLSQVPLKLQWSTSGSATTTEQCVLQKIINLLRDVSLDPIGIASDGDPFWVSYAILFLKKLIAQMNRNQTIFSAKLEGICDLIGSSKWFHDPLHLVKCDRYHKLKPKTQAVIPFSDDVVFDFAATASALNVSDYLLNDSQAKKMDDFLPIRLFKTRLMYKALLNQKVGFCYSITPSCLLLSVCFDENVNTSSTARFRQNAERSDLKTLERK